MEYKNFKSFTGSEVRVALISGHTFVISCDEWTPIPEFAWRGSYSEGATSEDTIQAATMSKEVLEVVQVKSDVEDMKRRAKVIIKGWVDSNDLSKFSKGDGRPKSNEVSKELGCRFHNAMRDEVWYKLQEEMD